jgi:NAD+ synthase
MDRKEQIDSVVEWLREMVKVSGTKGILVGISGGIDSAVVSFLIKKAFPENSLGVLLPCKSSDKDLIDGLERYMLR